VDVIIPTLAVGLVATLAVLLVQSSDDGAWDDGRGTHNFIGPVGHGLARLIFRAIGVSAYGVGAMMFIVAVLAVAGKRISKLSAFGWMLTALAVSTIAHLHRQSAPLPYAPGGALGRIAGEAARGAFSLAGSLIPPRRAADDGHPPCHSISQPVTLFQFAAVGTGKIAVGTDARRSVPGRGGVGLA